MHDLSPISDKLDSSLHVSMNINQEMDLMFSNLIGSAPLYAAVEDNNVAKVSVYIDRAHNTKVERIFGKTKRTEKGNYEVYEIEADDIVSELQIFRSITKIPSVIPMGFYLQDGRVHAEFRFHHSALDGMSELIREINQAHNKLKLAYLGGSPGLVGTLNRINTKIPLTFIRFSYVPSEGYVPPFKLEQNPVAEIKLFSRGIDADYDIVHYGSEPAREGEALSITNGIYEAKFRTEFMRHFKTRLREDQIPLISVLGLYRENLLENYMTLPTFIADHVLSLIFETAEEIGNDSLKLLSFVPWSNEI